MFARSLVLPAAAALLATSPLACKTKEAPVIPVVDDDAKAGPPPGAIAGDDATPVSDAPRVHVRASARELDQLFAWVKLTTGAWTESAFDVDAQAQAMLLQLGYGPGMWSSLNWQGVMAIDVLFPLSEDPAPGDLRAYGTLASRNPKAVLDAVPDGRRPQPLGNGMWEMVEETMRVLFREQPGALEFALVAADLDQASGLVAGASQGGRRIQVVADQIPEGWVSAGEFFDLPSGSALARRVDEISRELSELRFELDAGGDRDLTIALAARAPFGKLGLDPLGPPRAVELPVASALPGAPVGVAAVSWGDPEMLHTVLDRSLPLDQIPEPFAALARDAVGGVHGLLDQVKGDAIVGLYLSKSGKVALVLAAQVGDEQATTAALRAINGSLAKALESYRELAGGSKDAEFKVSFALEGGRLGAGKADVLTVSVPKNMAKESERVAFLLSKGKELEVTSGIRDGVAIMAIGGGAAEIFADKKTGTLVGDPGLALARSASGGCNLCFGVDPVGLSRLAAIVARDTADDPAAAKEHQKLVTDLSRLGDLGDLGFGVHVSAERGAIALGIPQTLSVPAPATAKKVRDLVGRVWDPFFEGEPEPSARERGR